ncbi:ribonuclease E activity regulator RraA [Glutamicibacter sp. X7]
MSFSTCDLFDGDPTLQSDNSQMRNFGAQHKFSGPIRTVLCYQDNSLVKRELATPGNGAVLVVDGGGSLDCALLGDMVAQLAVDNGWAGLVVNGAVRDSAALAQMPLGIKALGTNPRKSAKTNSGSVGVELRFGSVIYRPGLMLHSDEDGIVVEAI